MKIAVIILILLGLFAAGAAVIVVQMLTTATSAEATPMVAVIQAGTAIPALTPLKREHLVEGSAPPSGLPQGHLSSSAQAIGRILRVPLEEGQVLSQEYFIPEGTASDMIRLIPPGMLAYSLTLSGGSVNRYLLYPGCVVDILVVLKAQGQPMSLTLLQNLQIVAIGAETVLSDLEVEKAGTRARPRSSSNFIVTFKVTPEEAKALQLAVTHGRIGIGLRNPTDTERREVVAMVLNQGQLSEWAEPLDPGMLLNQMRELIVSEPNETVVLAEEPNRPVGMFAQPPAQTGPGQTPVPTQAISQRRTQRKNWPVTVIRGAKEETIDFLSEEETDQ